MPEFSLRGVSDMRSKLTDISREKRDKLSTAAEEEAEAIVSRSRDEFVPVKEGELRDTIRAVKGSLSQGRDTLGQFTSGSDIEVIITAGNENTPQALAVHEHPSRHDPSSWEGVQVQFHPSGRGPKFLERPLLDAVSGMAERAGRKVAIGILLSLLSVSVSYAQISGISARAFPVQTTIANLPTASTASHGLRIVTNSLDCETVSVGGTILCLDTGSSWELVGSGGSGSDDQTAAEVPITDVGLFYTGTEVESALQQIGADARWADSRTPTTHNHTAVEVTSLTFADARISSSSVTQHESALEGVIDLADLQGAVTDNQVPNNVTITNTASKCARYDGSGNLVAASGDCASGDTIGGTGDVIGPASSTANAIPAFDGTTGKLLQNSVAILSLTGELTALTKLVIDTITLDGGTIQTSGGMSITTTGDSFMEFNIPGNQTMYFKTVNTNRWTVDSSGNFNGVSSGQKLVIGGDTAISRQSADLLYFEDAIRVPPAVSPIVTCGAANSEGVIYTDTSRALCYCDGVAWQVLNPLTVGVGTCS